ncbi:MAG: hypothetical protein ACTSRI_20330 [Promethearchaeota archaeon]
MKININDIEDGLGGSWWIHIHASNFGFLSNIEDLIGHEVEKDDILVHKEIKKGDKFPTIRYHLVTENDSREVKNDEVKEIIAKNLVDFIRKNEGFPFKCKVVKFFKNGNAQVNYIPTQFDNFALKIVPKIHGIENIEEFFKDLKTIQKENPVISTTGKTNEIEEGARQWEITSSRDPSKKYTVILQEDSNWICSCPHYTFRKTDYRHIKDCKNKL